MENLLKIPLDEAFARWPHTPNVEARIRRFNPDGLEQGSIPRGWTPSTNIRMFCFMRNLMTITQFNELHGKGAHRALPKEAFRRCGGKRKAITGQYLAEHGLERRKTA